MRVKKEDYMLLLCTAFLSCSKAHELDENLPSFDEVSMIMEASSHLRKVRNASKPFTFEDFVNMEMELLNLIRWEIFPVLAHDYIETLLTIGIACEGDVMQNKDLVPLPIETEEKEKALKS